MTAPDPLEALRRPLGHTEPDRAFAEELRARMEAAFERSGAPTGADGGRQEPAALVIEEIEEMDMATSIATRRRRRWIAPAAVAAAAAVAIAVVSTRPREDVRSVDTGPTAPESPGPTSSTATPTSTPTSTTVAPTALPAIIELADAGATTVQTSIRPLYIAAGDGVVWVTSANGEVERLDASSGSSLGVTELRTAAGDPAAIAPTRPVLAFGSLWLQGRAGEVWRIDQASGAVRATIVVPGEVFSVANLFWHDLAVTADGVWLQRSNPAALLRIDPGTDRVVATIPLTDDAMAVAAGFDALWVTRRAAEGGGPAVERIDPGSGRIVATIDLPFQPGVIVVDDGGVSVVGHPLYLPVAWTRIDPATNTAREALYVGAALSPEVTDAAAADGALWVSGADAVVVRIDVAARQVTARFGAHEAGGNTIAAADGVLWITSEDRSAVYRLPVPR